MSTNNNNNFFFTSQVLGEGTFAKVYLGYDNRTTKPVAVKVFKPIRCSKEHATLTHQETDILQQIKSIPDTIHLEESFEQFEVDPKDVSRGRLDRCQVFGLVRGHNLFEVFHALRLNCLTNQSREFVSKILFFKLVSIVHQVHLLNIAHLDIKLENVMVDIQTGKMTLIDFGFAERFDPKSPVSLKRRSGSIEYCAPEIYYTDCAYDGTKADIWSLGVLLYVLLAAKFPFSDEPTQDSTSICDMPHWISPQGHDLLDKILRMDAYERPSALEILKHPWFDDLARDQKYIHLLMQRMFAKLAVRARNANADLAAEEKKGKVVGGDAVGRRVVCMKRAAKKAVRK